MTMNWKGVFPAVTTKLKEDGTLDIDAIKSGLNRLIDQGVAGVVMMGMVGENAQLSAEEKTVVLKVAIETVEGRVPVISGLAETSTASAVRFASNAEDIGVQGLMVFPGLTYRSDERETVAYYKTIASSTKLAIMIYNNPRGYGVDMTPELLEHLVDEVNVVAVKEESYDTTRVTDLYNRFGNRFSILCGVDDLILESAALGVTGWVSGMANAFPRQSVELLNLAVSGQFERARELYRLLTPLFHLDVHVKLVQYIKLAENITAGYPEFVKAPRLQIEGTERERVLAIVHKTMRDLQTWGA